MLHRYLAICRPLAPLARSTTGQAKKVIFLIWILSFASAAPWTFLTKVNYLTYNDQLLEESAWCSIPFTEEESISLYMMMLCTLIYYLIPLIIVATLYTR